MSVRPPDDLEYIDLDDVDSHGYRSPGANRRPRRQPIAPAPATQSWTDPRFLVPLILFLTAVFLIVLAFRSDSVADSNAALLEQENAVIEQSDLAIAVQEAELRAGFGGLIVSEDDGTIVIAGTVPDALAAASVGAVARSVEGTQRVDNRVTIEGGAVDAAVAATTTAPAVVAGGGGIAEQLADVGVVTFETGSTSITPEGSITIDAAAALINRVPGLAIEVHGHTDNEGDETANQVLSQARAEAVVSALAQRGVDTTRISAIGFGSSNPIAPNITDEGRATNRRIEFLAR